MARYRNAVETNRDPVDLLGAIENYLKVKGFKRIDDGENVWKKDADLIFAPQYIRILTSKGKLMLDAWIKFALLPGIYIGEMGIDGMISLISKKKLKKHVKAIERLAD